MKAWLQENIPALYVRYTTVMRYKAMAKRLRQVVGLADPVPAEAVLAEPQAEVPDLAVVRARAVWLEVLEGVRGSPTALMERLDSLTDPERVEESNMLAGWRAKYENEITGRMKSVGRCRIWPLCERGPCGWRWRRACGAARPHSWRGSTR